jgi:hypothetical protein
VLQRSTEQQKPCLVREPHESVVLVTEPLWRPQQQQGSSELESCVGQPTALQSTLLQLQSPLLVVAIPWGAIVHQHILILAE